MTPDEVKSVSLAFLSRKTFDNVQNLEFKTITDLTSRKKGHQNIVLYQ